MDNALQAKILSMLPTIISAFIGIVLSHLKSRDLSNDLNRAIEVCQDVIVGNINKHMAKISNFYQGEINRVLMLAFRNVAPDNIQSLEINQISAGLDRSSIGEMLESKHYINKLEICLTIQRIFRWLFWIMLSLALINLVLSIIFSLNLPDMLIKIIFIVTVTIIVLFSLGLVVSNNLMDKIRKKYGISF